MPSTFIENVEWGGPRPCCVYLSAGLQDTGREWPVLYLLHGIGGNETAWLAEGQIQAILDRLGTEGEGRIQPLAVVMPFGFLQDLPRKQRSLPDWAAFNSYFLNGLARVERTLRIVTTRDRRAIAGLSMGGLQALEVALNNLDLFSVIGTFSAALNMRNVEQTCRQGWLALQPNADRRSHWITATAKGRDVLERAYPAWKVAQTEVLRRLGAQGAAALKKTFRKLLV